MRWYQHRYHTPGWHRVVFAIIPRLPRAVHPPIAWMTALIFSGLLRDERRAVAENISHITGRRPAACRWAALRVFYSFCDFIVSYCYVPKADRQTLLAMLTSPDRGAGAIESCLARGRGLIVWTAHIGNWEYGSRLLELHGRQVNVARVVETGNSAEAMLRDLMTNERLRIVDLSEPLATVRLLHALRGNQIVAIQGDRVHHGHDHDVPLFGRRARFPLGPFLLAHAAGAPVLPGVVVREGWLRYRVVMGEPIVVEPAMDRDTAARAALETAIRFLEDQLRTRYDQWLNFYPFWPIDAEPGTGAGVRARRPVRGGSRT